MSGGQPERPRRAAETLTTTHLFSDYVSDLITDVCIAFEGSVEQVPVASHGRAVLFGRRGC